jgi:hypothetical protein
MPEAKDRLVELLQSLGEFDTDQTAPANVGAVYNALLGQGKSEKPGDPVVAALEPVAISDGSEFADITCGALRTVVQQLISAVDG